MTATTTAAPQTEETPRLPQGARILHVITESRGVVGEVAVEAIRRHAALADELGLRIGVASRRAVFDSLELPDDVAFVEIGARGHLGPADPGSSFALHRIYRFVDVVHAHGLHASALASAAMTGLPSRMRPALVTTVARYKGSSAIDGLEAKIVAGRAAAVLGTTEPVIERFRGDVPLLERARLLRPDVSERIAPNAPKAVVRENLGVPAGTALVAATMDLVDHPALVTVLEAAAEWREHRADRRIALALTGQGRKRDEIDAAFSGRTPVVLADPGSAVDTAAAADVVIVSAKSSDLDEEGLMQLGRPVIVVGDERAARPWGDAAVRVDADDTEGLIAALGGLLDDPARRAVAGIAALRRVDDVDDAGLLAEDLLDVYAAAAAQSR